MRGYVDLFEMPLYKKYLTDEQKVAGRTILNFIDWFSPTLEIKQKLQNEMIILLSGAAQYEKSLPIIREYYESKKPPMTPAEWHNRETDDVTEMMSEEVKEND
jgi:hypothetical protein